MNYFLFPFVLQVTLISTSAKTQEVMYLCGLFVCLCLFVSKYDYAKPTDLIFRKSSRNPGIRMN